MQMQHTFLTDLVHFLLTSPTCVSGHSSQSLLHGHQALPMVLTPLHYTTSLCSGLRKIVITAGNLRNMDGKLAVQKMRFALTPVPLMKSRLIRGIYRPSLQILRYSTRSRFDSLQPLSD